MTNSTFTYTFSFVHYTFSTPNVQYEAMGSIFLNDDISEGLIVPIKTCKVNKWRISDKMAYLPPSLAYY